MSEPAFPVTMTIPVAWGDMDAFGHVNNTVYLRWFESVRIEYFRRLGLYGRPELAPILARTVIDYRRPTTFPDEITIGTRVTKIGGSSLTMAYGVTSKTHGAVVAEGETVIVVYNYTRGEKVAIPPELRASIESLEGAVR